MMMMMMMIDHSLIIERCWFWFWFCSGTGAGVGAGAGTWCLVLGHDGPTASRYLHLVLAVGTVHQLTSPGIAGEDEVGR